jgi:cyclic pyranopterin phosphate synthase
MGSPLTHVDEQGQAHVVDVGEKQVTHRRAVAVARVRLNAEAREAALQGGAKGDVVATARIAGLMAVKRVPDLIPLCHTVAITHASVEFQWEEHSVLICATAEAHDRTGVEMEAITAATVAALTLYDMLKAVDRAIVIEHVMLKEKHGGRTGTWLRPGDAPE